MVDKEFTKFFDKLKKDINQKFLFYAQCECGEEMRIPLPEGWKVEIVGYMEFTCKKCDRFSWFNGKVAM